MVRPRESVLRKFVDHALDSLTVTHPELRAKLHSIPKLYFDKPVLSYRIGVHSKSMLTLSEMELIQEEFRKHLPFDGVDNSDGHKPGILVGGKNLSVGILIRHFTGDHFSKKK